MQRDSDQKRRIVRETARSIEPELLGRDQVRGVRAVSDEMCEPLADRLSQEGAPTGCVLHPEPVLPCAPG
jgi:hypothetical protein